MKVEEAKENINICRNCQYFDYVKGGGAVCSEKAEYVEGVGTCEGFSLDFKDFEVNDIKFEDYLEAKAYKQKLLDADESVCFSGFQISLSARVNFYVYRKFTPSIPFENRPKEVEELYNYDGEK